MTDPRAYWPPAAVRAIERVEAERDRLRDALTAVSALHRKSTQPASRGEHRGRYYCPACTTSIDDFTAYVDWPCPTAAALGSTAEAADNGEA